MAQNLEKLVLMVKAILTRVREQEGYVTKTKLFKYLYLVDVEWYRQKQCQYTGFQWIFHHYGPWSQDCEELYSQLRRTGDIHVQEGTHPDLETEFVRSSDRVDLEKAIDDLRLESIVRKIVDTWADRRLGDMLDYVYFRTEPMESAERGKALDFSKIEREAAIPSVLTLTSATLRSSNQHLVIRMRDKIAEKKVPPSATKPHFTPPPYDEVYFQALDSMKDDDD